MANVLIKMLLGLLTKLMTEKFIARLTVRLLWFLADKTPFEVDNGIVEDIAESLGVEDYK